MTAIHLQKIRFQNGLWEGLLKAEGADTPEVCVLHLDQRLPDVKIAPTSEAREWALSFPIPAETLNEGVQSFVIQDLRSQEKIGDFTFVAGEPLAGDLRAELDLLRAELDLLKRAFRRHCAETA